MPEPPYLQAITLIVECVDALRPEATLSTDDRVDIFRKGRIMRVYCCTSTVDTVARYLLWRVAFKMWLHIDSTSGVPIYLQIVQQIRSAVATGVLEEGEELPSVRELAVELAVNPNTVAKAYRELQRDGIISVARGSGTYVSTTPPSMSKAEVAVRLRSAARRVAAEAYSLGVSRGELMQVISVASNEVWGVDGKDGDAG